MDGKNRDVPSVGGRREGPLAILFFSAGLLLGMALFGGLIWSDFASIAFDPAWRRDAPLRSLHCPVMITARETGAVSVVVSNPLDRPTERHLRVATSAGSLLLTNEFTEVIELEPGESKSVVWPVTADDAVHGRLIMVNAVVRRRYPIPGRQSSCGILVVGVPYLTGRQVFGLSLAFSQLAMAGAHRLWLKGYGAPGRRGKQAARAMVGLGSVVLAGIVIGLVGWWLPGLILFLIVLVAIGVTIGYFLNTTPE